MRSKLKKMKGFIISSIIFILIIGIGIGIYVINDKKVDIILSTKSYSYLPKEAKNYIKEVYNSTGEIIKTEKNKVADEPYLNPAYVYYLENGVGEYGYIPEEFKIDHSYKNDKTFSKQESSSTTGNSSLSYYNLRDDGYITNVYDQGSEGLCWAFSSSTSLESHIAIKTNKSTMATFSEKQIDYATTTNGDVTLDFGENPYITSLAQVMGDNLNEGGNMIRFANATAIGISPVLCKGNCSANVDYNSDNSINDTKYWKYNYYYNERLAPSEVYNFENTEYSVDEVLFFNPLTSDDSSEVNSLVNILKNQIVNNGSVSVSVGAYTNFIIEYTPTGSEKALNKNGKNEIYYIPYGFNLASGMNHAVSIIGWDDNYSHTICLDKTNFEIKDAKKTSYSYSCSSGIKHTINGAWILQNSWGDSNTYLYLPYDTMESSYSVISEVDEIDYDNSYRATAQSNSFTKGDTKEVLNKVKFFVSAYNRTIKVYYDKSNKKIILRDNSNTSTSGTYLTSVYVTYPGLYTVDLKSQNIIFDESVTSIKLEYQSYYSDYKYFASIHTNNIDESDKFIDINKITKIDENILAKCSLDNNRCDNLPGKITFDENNVIVVSGISRNLTINDNLTFKILNENNEDVSSLFRVFRNYSVSNYINALISYNNEKVALGNYKIQVYYNGVKYDELNWSLTSHKNKLEGIGTEFNPHIIKTSDDLNEIRNHKTTNNDLTNVVIGYYELANDIDLTYDTQNNKGKYYNSGAGWSPIDRFGGSFNGNNHVIKGLYINRTTSTNAVGLFGIAFGLNNTIENIILKDVNVRGNSDVGALIGGVYDSRGIDIHDISIINGKVISEGHTTGGIIGDIGISANSNYDFYNLFNNANVGKYNSNFVGGIIGSVDLDASPYDQKVDFTIRDTINLGDVTGNAKTGGIISSFGSTNEITFKNIISLGNYKNSSSGTLGDIVGSLYNNKQLNISYTYYKNNIYGTDLELNGSSNISNNLQITFEDMMKTQYISIFDHKSDWIQPEIDGIKRIPMLKSMVDKFDFTETIEDFDLGINSTLNIYDLIYPKTSAARNIEYSYDDSYLTISSSGKITPKKIGSTTIHIKSLYDGYEDDIEVTIKDVKKVTYHSNEGTNKTVTQEVFAGEPFNLNKNTFTRKGYKFNLWCLDEEISGSICFTEEELMSLGTSTDLDLYANWSAINYGFKFDANGGYGSISTYYTRYPDSGKVILPDTSDIAKQHYVLDSWNTEPDGSGVKFSYDGANYIGNIDDIIFPESYHVTLFAQWKEAKYVVKFDANGGTGTMNQIKYTFGDTVTIPNSNFTRKGYKFAGWNTEADGTGIKYYSDHKATFISDTTLYAEWTPNEYSVVYYGNGATTGRTEPQYSLEYGTSYDLRNNGFNRNGYEFIAWNTEYDGTGDRYFEGETVKNLTSTDGKTVNLYAEWKIIEYEINYNLNGGVQNKNNKTTFDVTSKTFNLYNPTKKGYTFGGWYLNGTKTKITKVSSGTYQDINVFASWTANRYGIAYYGNGETSGTTTNQKNLKYGMSYNLSANGFKRKGYTFVGWNTKADGTGTYFSNQQKIKNFTSTNGKVVKLYAIWKKTKYKVNYELNGGTQNKKNTTSFYMTSKTFNLYNPTKKGYTFGGWYLNGTKTKITKVSSGTYQDINVFASWTANRYGIAYYGNGETSGTTTNQKNLKYGMSYNLSANGFKRKGYTFVGWNTKADGTGTYFSNQQKIKNFTSTNGKVVKLYAIWKKK